MSFCVGETAFVWERQLLCGRDGFCVGETAFVWERRLLVGESFGRRRLCQLFGGREGAFVGETAFELREPLGLARATWARTRCGSRAREGRRSNQRRRGRAASESVGAEETRAAGTRGNQRTSREVATSFFLFIWELNVSGV